MPRTQLRVKTRNKSRAQTPRYSRFNRVGAVDIHFHGAFGIDLMTADSTQMDELSGRLWANGIAGFCPTTLSVSPAELLAAVRRIGAWISSKSAPGAIPLGIHLEGPFISSHACGAHPPSAIRPHDFNELDLLWEESCHTLKILTLAPETLSTETLKVLEKWAKIRKITLSAGHSKATVIQAQRAFDLGFTGVTHAWNALGFHQREPGVLGAALGRKDVYLELIIDQVHVDPIVLRWTQKLHSRCCFVSDCVPAAATLRGTRHAFGSLQTAFDGKVCRLPEGSLAGGGLLLPEAYANWIEQETKETGISVKKLLKVTLPSMTTEPLRALGLSPKVLKNRPVRWAVRKGRVGVYPCSPPL